MEYDLLGVGTDLRDLFTGALSWRRLGVLIRGLPPESLFVTARRNREGFDDLPAAEPGVFGRWSQLEMIAAAVVDEIAALRFMMSDGKGPAPKSYPRPGTVAKVTPINERAAAYLREVERRHGAAPEAGWTG